jgi:hypothetical protein
MDADDRVISITGKTLENLVKIMAITGESAEDAVLQAVEERIARIEAARRSQESRGSTPLVKSIDEDGRQDDAE